jgi:hypothetical protein
LVCNQPEQKRRAHTSLAVALQWKILVIPLWMSSDFPSISKTDERIVLKSLRAKAVQDPSPLSCRLLIECRDPIDSEISDTASWRAQIGCRSLKGCVNCKNVTWSKNYKRTVEIIKDFRCCHTLYFEMWCNIFDLSEMIHHASICFMLRQKTTLPSF